MRKLKFRKGQAMIEMLLGLVGIMVLILGIDLIANIVYYDFTTIYSAREEVADNLMAYSAGTSGGSSTYNFDAVDDDFEQALNPGGDLEGELSAYPGGRENAFEFLWTGENPLSELAGSEKASSTPITSTWMQRVTGRSSVSIQNAIYMPPWEDLLYPEGGGE